MARYVKFQLPVRIGLEELSGIDSLRVSALIVSSRRVIKVKIEDLKDQCPDRYMRWVTVTLVASESPNAA